ncbi:MAG: sugar phosphate isomerase/epimerase [Clostridiales bacterium]|jgi:sugar phosphate isomerase/epimerase|nr:sugar phosphate isomerase/epimerase [Clostridiales bacterium]
MKIGICAALDKLEKFESMGFDYIEATVVSLMEMDMPAIKSAEARIRRCRISVEACNVFFPKSLAFVGPDADLPALKAYLSEAVSRVARIGAKIIVFGSGASRAAPAGFDLAAARAQLRDVIALAGETAGACGVTVAIEPLNAKETNLITSVPEGLEMARDVNHESVRLLADFYHMRVEGEPMASLTPTGPMLAHAHIARREGRTYPTCESEDSYGDFFAALKSIGYQGRLSIEGQTADEDADAPKSLAFLRSMADKAKL